MQVAMQPCSNAAGTKVPKYPSNMPDADRVRGVVDHH